MKWQIKLSSVARADIEAALDWTLVNFGEKQRRQYLELIGLALAEIGQNPETHRAKRRPEIHPDARVLHISWRGKRARHLFVYRMASGGQIEVGRFLHDAMDVERHLPEGFRADE